MLLAFTMCMGLMQNAAFASTGENSVAEEVVEAENIESSSEETIGEDIQEDSDLQGGTEEEGNSVSVEIINMGEETNSQDSSNGEEESQAPTEAEVDSQAPSEEGTDSQTPAEGKEDSQTSSGEEAGVQEPSESMDSQEPTGAEEVPQDPAAGEEASQETAAGETESEGSTEDAAVSDVLEEDETQAPEETETEEETTTEASEEAKEDETEAAAKVQEETLKTAPASKGSEWKDITDTKRPEATEDVTHDKGTSDDKLHIQDKNWDIFYDAEKDVYKITFNIGSEAEASTQVVDLTKALELLGQYAESGKQELQDAIDAIEKPVKGDAGKAPEMGEIDVEQPKEPEKPVAPDAPEKPQEPEKPVEPGKPEGIDESLQNAWDTLFDKLSGNDNPNINTKENVLKEMEALGINTGDKYVQDYAQYMVSKADNAFLIHIFETKGEGGNESMFKYFMQWESSYNGKGEPTDAQIAEAIASVQRQDNRLTVPEYTVDKNSEAYKEYEASMEEYSSQYAEYETKLKEYEAAQAEWLEKYGENSPEYQAYLAQMAEYQVKLDAYNAAKAEAEAEYAAAVADYEAKKAEIEKNYADDQAAYDAAIEKLKADFDRRVEADVLQPGDVKKFELYLTSDSKHTYKYQTGSFTLATPGWNNPNGTVAGFDGQILPDEYVDHAKYHVTMTADPMQNLFDAIGMTDPNHPNNKNNILGDGRVGLDYDGNGYVIGYPGYWENDIKEFLSKYDGETLGEKLNAYLLDYYNSKDGTNYTTINDLIQNNPEAQVELTKTTTSGNKWFNLDGEKFVVDAHLETVKYDTFYKQLFNFAFGDEEDINKILEGAKFNPVTNRWEYENDSWTDNGYQNALYYYMNHQEIWQKTDAYFNSLLDGGLSKEQATWTSLMMALNIDGELTGNDWQDTKWPWYSSIGLERVDIDFNLSKKDGETGETITKSETEFQIYYIDTVKNEDGTETKVNMYCTYNEESNSYTFVTTPSTIWTKDGQLNIDYAMMKDIVYYLQEMTAPEGYERDTNVYIVMNEEDYNKLTEEDRAALEGTFDKFLDMEKSKDGLTFDTDFVNVKIVPPTPDPEPTPDPDPDPDPDPTPDPDPDPTPDPEDPGDSGDEPNEPGTRIPDVDVPLTFIPDPEVPLANIPNENVPLVSIMDWDVPLASVPRTGDISTAWYAMTILSACCLLVMGMLDKKKREEENG